MTYKYTLIYKIKSEENISGIEETKGTIASFFYYTFFFIYCDINIRIILGETFSLHSISTTTFPRGE